MTKRSYHQYSYCSYCGRHFHAEQPWPRTCPHCEQTTFINPIPVAVLIQPVDGGVLTVRRDIEPQRGKLALPGGFVDMGESWQEAAARELYEEAGIQISAATIQIFDAISVPRNVLLFGVAPPLTAADLPLFEPNAETSERVVVYEPQPLAFPAHTTMLKRYLSL